MELFSSDVMKEETGSPGGKKDKMSSSLYILHKWCSFYVQLFACMVLKDYKTRTFIIVLTDDTYFEVLTGFVSIPVVLGKLLRVLLLP